VRRRGPVLVIDNDAAGRAADVGVVAVCVTSLEGLGRIVGRFGSEAAGFALLDYVQRLRSVLRDGDQLIQINESKYCLLLKDLRDANHALLAGQKLERAFGAPLMYRDTPIRLELRAGIASGPGTHGDAERLFRAAEAARESAVVQRCIWAVGNPIDVGALERSWRLADELDAAIENHHLCLYYQPQVACAGGQFRGAEGLIRWEHRDGLLTPEQFLPHLDASGMLALTGHVIRRCVSDLLAAPELPWLSVNLPATQLLDPVLQQQVLDELSLWGVDPARLTLEVAEEAVIENLEALAPGLNNLRTHGIRIVLDDCGAGRTELVRFRDLPIDGVKLDRRLVANMLTDPFDGYLTGMLIEFAHFLELEVTAKGVESTVIAERLSALGCDQLQGFGISPPLCFESFAGWRRSREVTLGS
jgi:EAL domain-containing protein (putative c-di-GMP-specific phosphodiesterase class I)/GGDEF domain-containing protein